MKEKIIALMKSLRDRARSARMSAEASAEQSYTEGLWMGRHTAFLEVEKDLKKLLKELDS
jgi:hypothetical protein